ncbi:SpoIIIAH-like family protein [Wansuia hejianensis]|uniref:SpoIIIAH-like family protein n=1 Tax=Wansuia hejianensis TaxID=2763667 RepID=A0A926EY94_9FIRM|nr:SpoIIIAH-like family protein [Wansuia hejianensis]MBC8590573.1 SpoIIIAH-like family protein [Wansuia hejianensis]
MFKIKRPAIIGLLLVLLVFTGYLNYELTQQALRKTSKDYQKHENMEKAKHSEDIKSVSKDKDIKIMDSKKTKNIDAEEVISTGNDDLEKEIDKSVSATSKNYFVEYRLSRDKLRAGLVDRLDGIVNNENTNDKMRTEAQEEIIKIGKISEKELQIEGLVKSKGYDEALVLLTEEDIKIIVSKDELTEQDMVKILDIAQSETGYDVSNIKIIKK